ncbi:SpoIIE family protein phosphatase [Dasania sp. GY-MA-18]|uniref:SpoIIE family protein phosphatase n=1 Tax=Dasania phycosphaerae TaxID=2950436 RepID=A0A9J6RIK8_9GAMM|nr:MULTISPECIES: SpoIIE family protein phosphatase [Dasania]MCR8921660.1 SpoIIE family protein phosphatase [Dasania sp. GY-MA-18]MCZ0864088.1 SpoIIE family protein phosphatase [Dasania phycosphaerae]MCZ0867816.1 SpoIIE family protein phosphatase [Dasania phycosphaerae]
MLTPAVIKILVVDDNPTDRLVLETILRKQGHQVVSADNGLTALQLFQQEQPDLILLDALMPGMDGFEVAERIKKQVGEDFIPIIFLTSLQDADSLARCLDAGGDDFISKPYNSLILRAKINAFTRMRAMNHTLLTNRDQISEHNRMLIREQEVAKRVFDKVAHVGCLDADNIKHSLSAVSVFNGDVVLAGVNALGNLMVFLGDFTGHGLDAALGAMPLAQTFYSMIEKGFNHQDILVEINKKLNEVLPVGVFCCGLLAEINFHEGTIKVWNGGLPDCVIYKPASGELSLLKSRHLPLGVLPASQFNSRAEMYDVHVGDRLYLWSDGIHEAENHRGEQFGEQRLFDVFQNNSRPESLFNEVNAAVNQFIGASEHTDDISVMEITLVSPENFKASHVLTQDSSFAGPDKWSMSYELNPDTLRSFNPLPLMLNVIVQVPMLRTFSGQIYTVLTELFNNALDHGVLKLESATKNSSEGFSHYYQSREVLLQNLQAGSIRFDLDYQGGRKGGALIIDVVDSGDGFDYQNLGLAGGDVYSGRGVHLVAKLCSTLEYRGRGNAVRAVYSWGESAF